MKPQRIGFGQLSWYGHSFSSSAEMVGKSGRSEIPTGAPNTILGQASFSRRNLGRPMPTLLTWGPSGFLRIGWGHVFGSRHFPHNPTNCCGVYLTLFSHFFPWSEGHNFQVLKIIIPQRCVWFMLLFYALEDSSVSRILWPHPLCQQFDNVHVIASGHGKVLILHQSNNNNPIHGNVQAYRYHSTRDLPLGQKAPWWWSGLQ